MSHARSRGPAVLAGRLLTVLLGVLALLGTHLVPTPAASAAEPEPDAPSNVGVADRDGRSGEPDGDGWLSWLFGQDGPEPAPERGDLPEIAEPAELDVAGASSARAVEVERPAVVHATGAELSWDAYVEADTSKRARGDDLVAYQVHRSTEAGFTPSEATLVAPVDPSDTSFTDSSIAPLGSQDDGAREREVFYQVVTETRDGELASSDERAAVVPPAGLMTTGDADSAGSGSDTVRTAVDEDSPGVYAPGMPSRLGAGETTTVETVVANTTDETWTASDVVLTHEWTLPGQDVTGAGTVRVPLPVDLAPGESVTVPVEVTAPASIGTNAVASYRLVWGVRATSAAAAAEMGAPKEAIEEAEEDAEARTSGISPRAVEEGVATASIDLVDLIGPVVLDLVVDEPTSSLLGAEDFYSYAGKNTGAGSSVMTNLALGNAMWQYNAFTNPGRGFNAFARFSYNSMDVADTGLGVGWSAQIAAPQRLGLPIAYDRILRPDVVVLADGDGTMHAFKWNTETDEYDSPPGVNLQLSYKPGSDCHLLDELLGDPADDAWTLLRPDGTRFVFDCEGYVRQAVDRNGNTQTFHYIERGGLLGIGSETLLDHVTDASGRTVLDLEYYEPGESYEYVNDAGEVVTDDHLSDPDISWHLRSVTDVSGRVFKVVYDRDGLLRRMVDGAGATGAEGESIEKVFQFSYDHDTLLGEARMVAVTDPRGNTTDIDYAVPGEPDTGHGERWQVEGITDRLDHTTHFDYWRQDREDAPDRVGARVTDANDNSTRYLHDLRGRPLEVTNALDQSVALTWDGNNNVATLTEANGAVTAYCYDPKTGYPIWTRDPEQNDRHGVPAAEDCRPGQGPADAPEGAQVLEYVTSADGYVADLHRKTSPAGRTWEFETDEAGNVTAVTDPLGVATDTAGDYTQTSTYDEFGQVTASTDANGNTTRYSDFHASGYPQVITDAQGATTRMEFDARGNTLMVRNAQGAEVTQTYDAFGRPLDKREPVDAEDGQYIVTEAPVYDANDNITDVFEANGFVSNTDYDAADQPVRMVVPGDKPSDPDRVTTTTYDAVGNVISETEPNGNATDVEGDYTTTTTYDAIYQPVSMTDADGRTVTSEYDDVGNLVELVDAKKNATSDPDDFTSRFEYDLLGRTVATIDAAGERATTRYDADSMVIGATDVEGHETLMEYDDRGALVAQSVPHTGSGDAIEYNTTRYEYDQVGNQTRVITPRGVATPSDPDDFATTTVYDELNQVVETHSATNAGGDSGDDAPDVMRYTYDSVGNMTEVSAPPSDSQSMRNITRYTYFDNGWTRTSTDPWDISTEYTYNELGQQTGTTVRSAGGSTSRTMTSEYYPSGNLAKKSDDGVPVGASVVLVDSSDRHNTAAQPSDGWPATEADKQYGYNTRTRAAGNGDASFTWQLHMPQDGTYEVFTRHADVTGAASDAAFTITHDADGKDGDDPVDVDKTVDQTQQAGEWISLGSYEFSTDGRQKITVTDDADGKVVADAVKLVRDNSAETDSEEKNFEYEYDSNGNMTRVLDHSAGAKIDQFDITYDQQGNVTKVEERADGTLGNVTTVEYDANGNPIEAIHPLAWSATEYNELDLATKVTNANSPDADDQQVTTMTYTPRGQLAEQVKPNGNRLDLTYYADGQVEQAKETTQSGEVVAQHDLSYTANGHPAREVMKLLNADDDAEGSDAGEYIDATYEYTYDAQDRITEVGKTGDDPSTETYTYDGNSNILTSTRSGSVDGTSFTDTTTNTYDRNRLSASTTATTSEDPSIPLPDDVSESYNYDPFGRLDHVTRLGETAQSYKYDGFDRTTRTIAGTGENAVTTSHEFDAFDRTTETSLSGDDGHATVFEYLGMDDTVLRESIDGEPATDYQYLGGGQRATIVKHPHPDEDVNPDVEEVEYSQYVTSPRGNVEAITQGDGTTRATYGYTAYGTSDPSQTTGEDAGQEDAGSSYNPYQFNSHRFDAGAGTYDMGFRTYDPGLNRFLTRDMYGGALADMGLATDPYTGNRYAFAGGNPISFIELDGHLFGMSWSDIGHAALDVVGMVPVVGEVADVANGIWYMAEGNYVDGAMSMASAIPLAGNVIGAAKLAKTGAKVADKALDSAKTADKATDAAAGANRATPPRNNGGGGNNGGGSGGNAPQCKNSFIPGTPVMMADGSMLPIEQVESGYWVQATDPETGDTRGREVTDTHTKTSLRTLVTVTVDDGSDDGGQVTATDEHPFWVPDYGRWVEAIDLQPGMWLQTAAGTWTQITAIDTDRKVERVHNLTVADTHTYHVGTGAETALTHNCGATQVDYDDPDSLAAIAIAERKANKVKGWLQGGKNVAVLEYTDAAGDVQHIVKRSKGRHAERRAFDEFEKKNLSTDSVTRVYTELAPCGAGYHNCDAWLGKNLPGAEVTYSFEYGPDKAGRRAGINALKRSLTMVRRGIL